MSAISLNNALVKSDELEAEYLNTIKRYNKTEMQLFPELLGQTIEMLEPEPRDVLGPLYMELELGNAKTGQFFTPPEICDLMASLVHGDKLKDNDQPYVKLCEPTVGSGGMVLAFVKQMLIQGLDPANNLWVQCIDIDRTVALMCYIQLTLWNVPAQVIVGNSLSLEYHEQFFTMAHHVYGWATRLHLEEVSSLITTSFEADSKTPSQAPVHTENKRIEVGKFEQIDLF